MYSAYVRIFPALDYLCTQASTLGHVCILRTYTDIPKNDSSFQRWIFCAYEQVPRDMDVFCVCTQLFLKQRCIICAYIANSEDTDESNIYIISYWTSLFAKVPIKGFPVFKGMRTRIYNEIQAKFELNYN